MDSVRILGNSAVHPGLLDLRDDDEAAHRMFTLLNLVVEQMISTPKMIDQTWEQLPADPRNAAEMRSERKKLG